MEWTSVKDKTKKPKIGQLAVCWLSEAKEPCCCRYEEDEIGPMWVELVMFDIYQTREDIITHWIPLPNPPEE